MFVRRSFNFAIFALAIQVAVTPATQASSYTLANGNSCVTIDATSQYGMSDWTVDGVPQLYRQWFWFRNGNTGGEKSLNQLTLQCTQTSDSTLTTYYQSGNKFSIEVSYSLLGGALGSGSSTIGEQIKITNLGNSVLDFHFFQYVDFDLGGSNAGDTVQVGQNISGLFDSAYQNKGTAYFADEFVSPGATHAEVGLYPSIYNKLNDNSPTTLSDYTGPVTGDATWAFQWDKAIAVGGSLSISLNKSVYLTAVPEPTAAVMLPVALAMFGIARRRFSSGK